MASIKMRWLCGQPKAVEVGSILKWQRSKPFLLYTLTSMIYGTIMEAFLDLGQNMTAYIDIKTEMKGVLKEPTIKAIIK